MEMKVNLGKDSYPIYIQQGLLDEVLGYIKPIFQGNKIMIISDNQVFSYYGEKIETQLKKNMKLGTLLFLMENSQKDLIFCLNFIMNCFHFN